MSTPNRPGRFTARSLGRIALLAAVAMAGASPVAAQGPSPNLVISQVYGGGGNTGAPYTNDYVELFNRSTSTVSLGGVSVQYASATGTGNFGANPVTPLVGSLAPGQYYLVRMSGGASGVPLPTPDATGTANMSGTAGKVVLVNGTTGLACNGGSTPCSPAQLALIIDLVGYGSANFFEGAAAAPGLSNTTAAFRAGGGCTDTNQNGADFTSAAPTPRNTAAPLNPCAGSTNPTVAGAATPASVDAGGTTLLTGTVTPGASPPSTGLTVTADLTPIGGSATQAFFDDGTHGDATPGDQVFSYLAVVATVTPAGTKTLALTVTDAQARTGSGGITLVVLPPLLTIHDIQGSGAASPYLAQLVRTTGVVTGRKSNGFFVQVPDGEVDADPRTSEGIFVFTSSAPPAGASIGNLVSIVGTVAEFVPGTDPNSPPVTEIVSPTVTVVSAGNPLPAPVELTPALTRPDGPIDQLEPLEGMRVLAPSLTVVAPTGGTISEANATSTSNGVFYGVLTGLARPFREPGVEVPDPLPAGAPCCVPRFDANPERIRVDSDAQVGAAKIDVTTAAVVTGLVGPLDYGFRTYTIVPDPGATVEVTGNVTWTGVAAPGPDEVSVATFNAQRFYDTVNDPDTSDVALTAAAFDTRLRKLSQIVRSVLRQPDILGLQEVENLATLEAIAARVNDDAVAAGEANPGYQAYLVEGNDIGGIDVGFLVKEAGGRVTVVDVTQENKDETYINPITGLPELLNDRPPLVLSAVVQHPAGPAFPITAIANHLRSLTGVDDPVEGARVRAKRQAQAESLARLVQGRQAANPDERIAVLGDFNAYQFNDGYVDTLGTVRGTPTPPDHVVLASADLVDPDLADLVEQVPAAQQYSFTFDGSAQELDHILVTGTLLPRLVGLRYGRVGADFPEAYRGDPDRPERLSDHDPLAAVFTFPTADLTIVKTASPATIVTGSTVTYTLVVTNGTGDAAEGVAVTDTLPAQTGFASVAAPAGWSCTAPPAGDTGSVSCSAAAMPAESTATITIAATLACDVANGTAVVNTASVTSDTLDPNPANNTSTVTSLAANLAPAISTVTASPSVLWPPNHRMRNVTLDFTVTDNCGPVTCGLAVTSDEPVNGTGDGDTAPDWEVLDAFHLRLRAERAGMLDGRVYTVSVTCGDSAGNTSTATTEVSVPQSRR